jgi:hypothetical protein
MKKLLALSVAAALVASVPAAAQNPPYKIPPGQFCKGTPKTKLPGHKKTQFAECVTAMAKINKNQNLAPSQVCASMKKVKPNTKANRAKGRKAFSRCVAAGKKLKLALANT